MDFCMPTGIEIERRYLIERPDEAILISRYGAEIREIEQTYLVTPPGYSSERVRSVFFRGERSYTHTRKRRISSATALEEEETVDAARYRELLLRADPERNAISKRRIAFFWKGQSYEIDLYPFWERVAILETELNDEGAVLSFPSEIKLLREITGFRELSNHALARRVPSEEKLLRLE